MTKDEALKLAREALEYRGVGSWRKKQPAITAIKQALANDALEKKAENARELGLDYEPVAFVKGCNRGQWEIFPAKAYQIFEREQPLYTTPPQRKPLTEQEIGAILEDVNAYGTRLYTFARAIEAKLKEKNT